MECSMECVSARAMERPGFDGEFDGTLDGTLNEIFDGTLNGMFRSIYSVGM